MANKLLGNCPVCGDDMKITSLKCFTCKTTINGNFNLDRFSNLTNDQLQFIEVFIKSRGNIKEVERELGISYPTVRNKLDEVIKALGYNIKESPEDDTAVKRKEILSALERGEINSEEAVKKLKKI